MTAARTSAATVTHLANNGSVGVFHAGAGLTTPETVTVNATTRDTTCTCGDASGGWGSSGCWHTLAVWSHLAGVERAIAAHPSAARRRGLRVVAVLAAVGLSWGVLAEHDRVSDREHAALCAADPVAEPLCEVGS